MANRNKTVKNRTEHTIADLNTGQAVRHESTVTYKVAQGPDFVKVFIEAFTDELKLNGLHVMQIFHMARRMDYENVITLTPGARVRISEAMGMKVGTFRNYLNDLIELDVFRRISHGEFMMNPRYIAMGKFEEIEKRQERYYKIERVKTKEGRKPGQVKNQGNLELM